jgi:hypothetical protein
MLVLSDVFLLVRHKKQEKYRRGTLKNILQKSVNVTETEQGNPKYQG